MPFSINPDLIENNDVEIQTVDGELALFHKPSGNTLIVDEDTSVSEKLQSPLSDDVDFDGNDLNSGGEAEFTALEADDVTINKTLNSQLDQGTPSNPTTTLNFGSGAELTGLSTCSLAVDGDNSAANLVDLQANRLLSSFLIASGSRQSDTDYTFTDIIAVARVESIQVIGSAERRSPGTRSYSRSGPRLNIAIDDSGETYDVGVIQLGGVDS